MRTFTLSLTVNAFDTHANLVLKTKAPSAYDAWNKFVEHLARQDWSIVGGVPCRLSAKID